MVADVLFNLGMEYNFLKLKEGLVTATMVVCAFVGNGKYRMLSLNQAAQTTMRLPKAVIEAIRDVANVKDPVLRLHSDRLSQFVQKTIKELTGVSDCRPVAAPLHTPSLKAATQVMNRHYTDSEKAQVDTIHRCTFYCSNNNFRPVYHSVVSEVYQCAFRPLTEVENIFTFTC